MQARAQRLLYAAILLAVFRASAAQTGPDTAVTSPVAAPVTAPAVEATAPAPAVIATPAMAPTSARTLVLHANSLVPLRFMETVGSDVSKPGDTFRMKVTDDINVDDAVVIPAGSIAVGEVIDAQSARAFGKAGKLVVSARYVLVGERQIKLHSTLGSAGNANTVAALFVPFIHGKQTDIPADSEVVAKIAHDESFEIPNVDKQEQSRK